MNDPSIQCVAVGVASKPRKTPIFIVRVYETAFQKQGKKLSWKLSCELSIAGRNRDKIVAEAKQIAEQRGITFDEDLRHGQLLTAPQLDQVITMLSQAKLESLSRNAQVWFKNYAVKRLLGTWNRPTK